MNTNEIINKLNECQTELLLLDDFFAKLDVKNLTTTLLKHTKENQTIITTTNTTKIEKEIDEIIGKNTTKEIKIIKL